MRKFRTSSVHYYCMISLNRINAADWCLSFVAKNRCGILIRKFFYGEAGRFAVFFLNDTLWSHYDFTGRQFYCVTQVVFGMRHVSSDGHRLVSRILSMPFQWQCFVVVSFSGHRFWWIAMILTHCGCSRISAAHELNVIFDVMSSCSFTSTKLLCLDSRTARIYLHRESHTWNWE